VKSTFRFILVCLIVTAMNASAFATESGTMSCQGGIVSIGDTAGEVVSKCGQPAYATQREQKKVTEGSKSSRETVITTVTIDDWTFNFGPNQFQYRLLLENGRVASIESLNYGY
jgi:Protein of unknown function (DUF2845)